MDAKKIRKKNPNRNSPTEVEKKKLSIEAI